MHFSFNIMKVLSQTQDSSTFLSENSKDSWGLHRWHCVPDEVLFVACWLLFSQIISVPFVEMNVSISVFVYGIVIEVSGLSGNGISLSFNDNALCPINGISPR